VASVTRFTRSPITLLRLCPVRRSTGIRP